MFGQLYRPRRKPKPPAQAPISSHGQYSPTCDNQSREYIRHISPLSPEEGAKTAVGTASTIQAKKTPVIAPQDTKCNSGDLMLALPIQREHLTLFAFSPLSCYPFTWCIQFRVADRSLKSDCEFFSLRNSDEQSL